MGLKVAADGKYGMVAHTKGRVWGAYAIIDTRRPSGRHSVPIRPDLCRITGDVSVKERSNRRTSNALTVKFSEPATWNICRLIARHSNLGTQIQLE